ncbi:MAG: YeeE/YedE family protein [Thiomonas sp.]|nr:YeeE/YedE family protein [Thiomonas sp.]
MPSVSVHAINATVLWGGFALSLVFGAIMQRTRFCTMGSVSDIVNMGSWMRMRMWVLAIATATIGFNLLAAGGVIDASQTIYTTSKVLWLSALVGGLLFGFGMVLASGCGSKTLVRIGEGNLKAVVVFMMIGVFAYITLRGITAEVRVRVFDKVALNLSGPQDLPAIVAHATGLPVPSLQLALGLGVGLLLGIWALSAREFRNTNNLLAGFGLGAVIVGVWFLSGKLGFLAEDPQTLQAAYLGTQNNKMESLSFVAPLAYTLFWFMMYSDASNVLTLGVVSVFGVIAGSAGMALITRQFRWEGFRGAEDTANHLVGGALMGIGGVTALGCTIGQGMSGVSTLSITSWIAFLSIVGGAVLGVKYQAWRVERAA